MIFHDQCAWLAVWDLGDPWTADPGDVDLKQAITRYTPESAQPGQAAVRQLLRTAGLSRYLGY